MRSMPPALLSRPASLGARLHRSAAALGRSTIAAGRRFAPHRRPSALAPPVAALPGASDNMNDVTREELPKWLTLAAFGASLLSQRAGLG